MEFNLKKILMALLFSTSEAISIRDIQAIVTRYHEQKKKEKVDSSENSEKDDALDSTDGTVEQEELNEIINQVPALLTATQIREAIDELNIELKETAGVVRILQGPEGFRLLISPEYAEWVRLLRNDPRPQRLSQAALETLAIVAYRQPVTRAEMEMIRGVSVDGAVSRLLEMELIMISGRADLPGRPSQFSTTQKFLDFIGLKTISELPESDVLSPAQIAAWIAEAKNVEKSVSGELGLQESHHLAGEVTLLRSIEDNSELQEKE